MRDAYLSRSLSGEEVASAGGVDYFVSSSLFEDEGFAAQRKYSERLVLMKGMVIAFPR